MHLGKRHLIPAVGVAVLMHAGLAVAYFMGEPPAGTIATGVGGLEISLGSAGGTPASTAADVPTAVAADTVEAVAAETPPPVEVQETVPAETIETVEAVADPVETVEVEPVETAAVEPPPPPKPQPVAQTPRAETPPPADPAPTPPPSPAAAQQTTDLAALPSAGETPPDMAATGQGPTNATGSDTKAGANTGTASAPASGGHPGVRRDYMTELAAILTRHKRYPRRAQSRRQEGTGLLFFVVNADGSVAETRLHSSSGYDLLDREILAILDRVGKLPPIPQEMGVARLEVVVPVNFGLR